MKKTKQGVRDLNYLKGKSVGRKLDPLPEEMNACSHKRVYDAYFEIEKCLVCGAILKEF